MSRVFNLSCGGELSALSRCCVIVLNWKYLLGLFDSRINHLAVFISVFLFCACTFSYLPFFIILYYHYYFHFICQFVFLGDFIPKNVKIRIKQMSVWYVMHEHMCMFIRSKS